MLDEGDGVVTWLGTDLRTQERVVLRTAAVEALSSTAIDRLVAEARVLRAQAIPGLVPLRAVGRTESLAWTVHAFTPGLDLARHLTSKGPLDVAEAVQLGRGLALALDRLHAEGRVHRGVRPSHVVLPEGLTPLAAVILPFGLAGAWRDAGEAGRSAGPSLGFMAPEQAGVRPEPEDARTDLYGLGAVLFGALSGQAPFHRGDPAERLRDMLLRPAPALRTLGLRVPRALEAVVERLLQKDPRDRYQTARGVLHDLDALQQALDARQPDAPLVIGSADRRRSLAQPDFAGRQEILAGFDAALSRARAGTADLWVQRAPTGAGLSRLLEEEGRRAATHGAWVLRVDARTGDAPGIWLARLARQVAEELRVAPDRGQAFRGALGPQASRVQQAFPCLAPLLSVPAPASAAATAPTAGIASGAPMASPGAALLSALAWPNRAVLVLVDDAHDLDGPSVAALLDAFGRAGSGRGVGSGGRRPTALVVLNIDEDTPDDHALRRLTGARAQRLPPLVAAEVTALALSMAGPLPPEVLARVLRLAGGSPFAARAGLTGLVETGALTADDAGWRLVDPGAADRSSAAAAALLTDRIDRLGGPELRWLTAGALLGEAFRAAQAGRLAELDAKATRQAAVEAVRHHFVWRHGSRVSFVHPGLRAALVERLAPNERRALHKRAVVLLRAQPGTAADLARHLAAADEPAAALAPALEASAEAAERGDLPLTAELLAVALLAMTSGSDRGLRRRLHRDRGRVLTVLGQYAEARHHLDDALASSESAYERAEILGNLGELAYRQGSPGEAHDHLVAALALVGRDVPSEGRGRVMGLGRAAARQLKHLVTPERQRPPTTAEPEVDELVGQLLRGLTYAGFFIGGPLETLRAHLEHLNLMETHAPSDGLAASYADHAMLLTEVVGAGRLAERYARRSVQLRASTGTVAGRGESGWFLGQVLYEAGRLEEALAVLRTAVPTLRRAGDRWEADLAHYALLRVRLARGELRLAHEDAQRLRREAEARGSVATRVRAAQIEALATGGQLAPGVLDGLDEANIPESLVRFALAHTRALVLLHEGRAAEAAQRLDAVAADIRRCGMLLNSSARMVLVHRVTAWRRAVELTSPYDRAGATHRLQRTRAALREARVVCWQRPLQASALLRERGLIAALEDRGEAARRLLDESMLAAEKHHLRAEAASTATAMAAVAEARRWPDAGHLSDRAQRLSAALAAPGDAAADGGRSPNPALADRFAAVLAAGRRIAASLSVPAIHLAAGDAARSLLRAEQVRVMPIERGLVPGPEHLPEGVDAALVREALSSRRVVRADATDDLAGETGSRLCAPILSRGRPAAVLYAEMPGVSGAFGLEEATLAEFVTSLAGIALDNAAGFEAVKNLGRALEERTVQLLARNDELLATQEELEAFSYSVAHDLRGGLLAVNGFASALQEDYAETFDGLGRDYLTRLQRTAVRLGGLTAALMVLSGVSRGEMRSEDIDLSALAYEVCAELSARYTHPIRWAIASGLTATGDPDMVRSVLQNLFENAAKFTRDAADPAVRFGLESGWFVVADNGAGFDMRYADKLFRPFQRLHDAHEFEGTGVGLATVRRVIRRHGGEITAHSAVGEGTVFKFTLRGT